MTAPQGIEGLDATLSGWLEAATTGGLPAPTRSDRWQPLRAGVVNLWEFEAAEYWYAQGWVQLTGRNETGKSSLMTLTTLIPWLADTSSVNIDTLGRSGKRFRFYVEPTGNDGDRRGTEGSSHRGWLWVEYGRIVDGEPRFFTTALFAEARTAAAQLRLIWCTAEGPRVRDGLDLAPGRVAAHPKEIKVRGFRDHPTAAAYKEHVAAHLLGSTIDRLEAVGKMLRVTRTPKLGAQLEIGFVREQLRSALPELDRGEVNALAAGWDQLQQIQDDLAATKAAGEELQRFRRAHWIPWVRAELRRRADAAARARTDFDRVTKDEREAIANVERFDADARRLADEEMAARRAVDSARAAADELQASTRYQDAQQRLATVEQRRREVVELTEQQRAASVGVARASDAVGRADAEVTQRADQRNTRAQAVADARDALAGLAEATRIPLASGEVDLPVFRQRLQERKQAIARSRGLLRTADDAHRAAGQAESHALTERDRARQARQDADRAWMTAQAAHEALVRGLADWAAALTDPPATTAVDAWTASLPDQVGDDGRAPGVPVRELIRTDWFEPRQQSLLRSEQDAQRRRDEATRRATDLAARIDDLRAAPVPVFPPAAGWVRRERPASSEDGAPLWSLVDPRPGVPDSDLASIEAALAALGLLDAWVTPDGVHDPARDGDDILVAARPTPATPSGTLAELLQPADGPTPLTGQVAALLARIRTVGAAEALPESGLAVARDGRFRGDATVGRASPRHPSAEWIGESARAAQRERLIRELTEQREAAQADARAADAEAAASGTALATLAEAFDRSPGDDGLRAALVVADERERSALRTAEDADQADARATELRTAADVAQASLHSFCADHALPFDSAGLDGAVDVLSQALEGAHQLAAAHAAATTAEAELASARERLAEREAERDRHQRALDRVASRLAELTTTLHTLESTLAASDQALVDELHRLRESAAEQSRRSDDLRVQARTLEGELGQARATRDSTAQRRIEATEARDRAFAAFRVVIDAGLHTEVEVELPDPLSSSIDRVREQVAEVRRAVSPRGWSDDPQRQDVVLKQLASRLSDEANTTRQHLETSGRSLHISYDDAGLPRVEVRVDTTGQTLSPLAASTRLAQIHAELDAAYNRRVQETLDELLGSTFLEHLRDRIGATDRLIKDINSVLADHATVTSSTTLRILLQPDGEIHAAMLGALRGSALANPDVAAQLRQYLRSRVEEAKQLAMSSGEADWSDRLARTLDYRNWQGVHLQKKSGAQGRWAPLTSQSFTEMSGGARAVTLMLPLVATLATLYADMDGAPRPLWLDEAFDGLDAENRAMIMALFHRFDLDVLLAGPNRLVNVRTVPAASIYQVVRAPAPLPGADLTLELWTGRDLVAIDLPATLPNATAPEASDQGTLL